MAHRKSTNRSAHAHRCLHLESFESRLALSAAEMPTTDFQFNGTILERWSDEQAKSDTIVIAPAVPRELPPEAIQNLLTIVGSIEQRPGSTVVSLDRVRDWLDRRGVEFSFTLPATDGGYIDLFGPADFTVPNGLGSYEESGSGELFVAPRGPATLDELGSLDETAPAMPAPTPSEPGQSGAKGGGEVLEAWSSLGRPAVIAIDGTTSNAFAAGNVKYAGASEAGGWIALEPILAHSEFDDIEVLRLASPDANESEHGAASAGLDLNRDDLNREDALAGEWARAAVFEMIGGDPTESQPAGRAASGTHLRLKQDHPSISDSAEPSPTLGAATLPSQAVLLLSGTGWLDEMADWMKARAGAAIENLFGSDEDDASSATTGWRDYAGAGALLVAIALERLSASYREDRQNADAARCEKLRLRRAEFTNRLSMRLKPIETR